MRQPPSAGAGAGGSAARAASGTAVWVGEAVALVSARGPNVAVAFTSGVPLGSAVAVEVATALGVAASPAGVTSTMPPLTPNALGTLVPRGSLSTTPVTNSGTKSVALGLTATLHVYNGEPSGIGMTLSVANTRVLMPLHSSPLQPHGKNAKPAILWIPGFTAQSGWPSAVAKIVMRAS